MNISFAQPYYLWGLLLIPVGVLWNFFLRKSGKADLSGLSKFIDKNLLPHLLLGNANKVKRKYIGLLYSLLVFFIIVALANPRWSYKDIDAFQPTASMVVLLDLANTMNATDISPSRIIRARQNLEDLLNLSKGLKIGLIGFAGYPHLISPITDDIQTIKTYLPALDTDLTTVQGNSLSLAFKMAANLLENEPGEKKSILLVSDGNFASNDFSHELKALHGQNIIVHVIGVGTTNGAPFKNKNGSLHKSQGKIATSKLHDSLLKEIAKQGHGIYTEAGHTDLGIRAILMKAQQSEQEHIVAGKIRQWDDRYYLFLIPAAAILLYLMRQRVLYILILGVFTTLFISSEVYAVQPKNAFKNSDQLGQECYISGEFKQAAEKFKDPYRKGVALYRAGEFAEAEKEFKQVDRASVKNAAIYNAGNAQMQQRKWRAAIKSYESVLASEPDNFAAQHNLEIARKMLAENDKEDQSDCECDNKEQGDKGDQSDKKKDQQQNNKQEQRDQQQQQSNKQEQRDQQQQSDKQKHDDQQQQAEQNKPDLQDAEQKQAQADADEAKQREQKQSTLTPLSEDEARVDQWLSRIDSDIKVFLKNKFYVEDVLGAQ